MERSDASEFQSSRASRSASGHFIRFVSGHVSRLVAKFAHQFAALAAVIFVFVFAASAQMGQPQITTPPPGQRPPMLQNVGISQNLNAQLPLNLQFKDENGQDVTLGKYFGKRPVILNMVYYNCPMLCGEVLSGLSGALGILTLDLGKDFDVLTVSFDPHDTPAQAALKKKAYIQRYHRPGAADGWHFLTGQQDSISALAKAVGFQYQYDPKLGQFAHAAAIMIVTPTGKIAQYYYGVEYSPKDLRLGLVEASNEKIGTVVDQILLYCYHYDPATGKYGAIITRVLRLSGVATILILGGLLFALFRIDPQRRQKRKKLRMEQVR
ncbi:MAG TPA: SCO family protein [Ktedonobacteraceae bacterium]|nr:SCO family protein [Ktedonobacteraceae bacterium]